MKKRTFLQKLCAIFTVSALLLGTGSAIAPAVSAAAEPDAWHDDWLHVNDNAEIVDRNGNPVWLTGCNWFGYIMSAVRYLMACGRKICTKC